jgi:hypothetical protein
MLTAVRSANTRSFADDGEDLLLQIERHVGIVLEQTQLALCFQAHATRRGIRDAAIGEAQARIRDVDLFGKYAAADGIDRHHG